MGKRVRKCASSNAHSSSDLSARVSQLHGQTHRDQTSGHADAAEPCAHGGMMSEPRRLAPQEGAGSAPSARMKTCE